MIFKVARAIVDQIGSPAAELDKPWVKYLCALNGVLAALQYVGQWGEKNKFPVPRTGERKVASFNVMNQKYVGALRLALYAHIAGGMTAQLGSSLAIVLEERWPAASRKIAQVAAAAEALGAAPNAAGAGRPHVAPARPPRVLHSFSLALVERAQSSDTVACRCSVLPSILPPRWPGGLPLLRLA